MKFKGALPIILTVGILVLLGLIFLSFDVVDTSERGVLVSLGQIKGDVLQPGLKVHAPFIQNVRKYSIVPNTVNIMISIGEDSIISKDNQDIGAQVDVYWKYDENKIVEVASNYSKSSIETIIVSSSKNAIKTVMGRYDVYSLAESQATINEEIKSYMIDQMHQYPIVVTDVRLINIDWSPAFTQSIEETMKLTQQVKMAEQNKSIAQVQADTQVLKAEADKRAMVLQAEAEYETAVKQAEAEKEKARLQAEAKVLEGDAIAKYNQAIQSTLDTELKLRELDIELTRVEKWDGKYVPTNNYGPIPVETGLIQGI